MAPPNWAYQIEYFQQPPDEELVCSICRCVFCEPVQCPCLHVFCKACVTKWLQKNGSCPICRRKVARHSVKDVVPLIRNIISKLKVICRYTKYGCDVTCSLEEMENHAGLCGYKMVRCTKSCKLKFPRKDIQVHESSGICDNYEKCDVCELKIIPSMEHDCVAELKKQIKKMQKAFQKQRKEIEKLKEELKHIESSHQDDEVDDIIESLVNESSLSDSSMSNFSSSDPDSAFERDTNLSISSRNIQGAFDRTVALLQQHLESPDDDDDEEYVPSHMESVSDIDGLFLSQDSYANISSSDLSFSDPNLDDDEAINEMHIDFDFGVEEEDLEWHPSME